MMVSATGSTDSPVTAASMLGIAKITARAENSTTTPTVKIEKIIALGTARSGSLTSSAMSPALSNPTNAQPTNATAANKPLQIHGPSPYPEPKLSKITLIG